ncbi:hypothetical protein ACQ86N_47670 [Puia sp. P3]
MPAALRRTGADVREVVVYRTEATPQKIVTDYKGILFSAPAP